MASWLEEKAPRRFDELLLPEGVSKYLIRASLQSNPPHLLISGPTGIGKTVAWRLVARQVLGPSWQSTTHILQAKDLAKTSGAMKKFEDFHKIHLHMERLDNPTQEEVRAGKQSVPRPDKQPAGTKNEKPNMIIPDNKKNYKRYCCKWHYYSTGFSFIR